MYVQNLHPSRCPRIASPSGYLSYKLHKGIRFRPGLLLYKAASVPLLHSLACGVCGKSYCTEQGTAPAGAMQCSFTAAAPVTILHSTLEALC